jgi:hypothetical protein
VWCIVVQHACGVASPLSEIRPAQACRALRPGIFLLTPLPPTLPLLTRGGRLRIGNHKKEAPMARYGRFVWRELLANDVELAKKFYGDLAGWTYDEHGAGSEGAYTHVKIGDHFIAGMMKKPGGVPDTIWAAYVSVDDVDARTHAARSAGATIVYEPTDIANVGRFSTAVDPTGAVISLHKGLKEDPEPYFAAGTFVWEQLVTTDVAAAKQFYAKVLGWRVSGEGMMTTFGVGEGMANQVASVVPAGPGVPSHWVSSIAVKSLARAKEIVHAQGGKLVHDRIEVPSVGAFIVIRDPQGAVVCLFEGNANTPMP